MILVCTHPFGNFKPGDEVEVPDGAVFDGAYYAEKQEDQPAASTGSGKEKGEQ